MVFAGSRALQASASALVGACVRSVLGAGRGVAVGCAAGGDQFALSAALAAGASASPLRLFAVGGPVGGGRGGGFWRGSGRAALLRRGPLGRWVAGGRVWVALRASVS